jgi:ubiquitin carboxyl-terminal hydrolase L5
LLNIIMNACDVGFCPGDSRGLDLGDKLREFKAETIDLNPVMRGNRLSNDSFIRTIHNSFARFVSPRTDYRLFYISLSFPRKELGTLTFSSDRRLDLLNADLALEVEVKDSKKKKARAIGSAKKKKKPDNDAAYHFIAYVHAGQKLYQLDGLQTKPRCLVSDCKIHARASTKTMVSLPSRQLCRAELAACCAALHRGPHDAAWIRAGQSPGALCESH